METIGTMVDPFDPIEAHKLFAEGEFNKTAFLLHLGTYVFAKHHFPEDEDDLAIIKAHRLLGGDVSVFHKSAPVISYVAESSSHVNCCGGGEVR